MMPEGRQRHFGSTVRLREDSREVWLWPWLEQLWQDLCYGARALRGAPGFTLGAVAVLALGVGVNLAEFQIFDAVIHRIDVRDASSLIRFARNSRQGGRAVFPHAAIEFYRAHSRTFVWLIGEESGWNAIVENDPEGRLILASPDYFSTLGIVPAWGRLLNTRDAERDATPAAVLGYDYWRTRWGADPNVVGRFIRINNHLVRIVGVLPYTFLRGLWNGRNDVWIPDSMRDLLKP